MKTCFVCLMVAALTMGVVAVSAQRPADAPATAPSGTPPDTVFLEDLTWAEVRDLVKSGWTTVIIGTAGTEQKGPHMVDGEHKFVMEYAADKIARVIGKTLVAPVVTYVPEGSWTNLGGHMSKPGTITLPEDPFVELLTSAGRSLKSGGFTTLLFIGESGGNQTGMRTAADRLNGLWNGSPRGSFGDHSRDTAAAQSARIGQARALWIGDYYAKSHAEQNAYVTKTLGIPAEQIGNHANVLDTSEMLFVNPKHIRPAKIAPGGGYPRSGVSGDPSKSSAELGKVFLQIKIDNAVRQIRVLMSGSTADAAGAAGQRGAGRGQTAAQAGAAPSAPPRPTMDTAPAGLGPTSPPDTLFIDELTWEETRDLMKAGKTTVIVPTGGTEKNGYHMTLGKHNVIVSYAANAMARRLGNALIAPVIQYVPEGNADRQNAGAISLPSPGYDQLLDAAARSLEAHGFREILFIGDSGGNQAGMRTVANALNEEWKGRGVRVFALTDYYEQGRNDYRAWLLATYKYDDKIVGSHAGVSDTSQLLFVKRSAVRKDRIQPWGGPADSGVSGDPTRATAEIGEKGVEFKVAAGLRQYAALKKGS